MKKTAYALMLIFALLFSSAELVEMAECNPYWTYEHVDPVPGVIPPSISIYNPLNYTSYSNSVTVNVLVNKAELAGWGCNIEYVDYSIDGRNVELYTLWQKHEQSEEIHPITIPSVINFTLSSLALGKHTLTVTASVAVLGNLQVFFLDCNSTIYFTVDDTLSSPSPSPSPLSTHTPEPTPTLAPLQEVNVDNTSQYIAVGGMVAVTVAILAVVLGLLIYRIKRK